MAAHSRSLRRAHCRRVEGAIRVALTCDADPDQATRAQPERTTLTWRGLDLVPPFTAELTSRGIPYTLFVRADAQIGELFGSPIAMFRRQSEAITGILGQGGEIGWHPHLCERVADEFVPVRDDAEACRQIRDVFAEMAVAGLETRCVRIGEAWHSTAVMRLLDELGLLVDSTALPGRSRRDDARNFDWEPTPNRPYRPSARDYRIPGAEDALGILEVPMTTAPVLTAYDREPLRRYLNPTFRPELFRAAAESHFGSLAKEEQAGRTMVLVLHPGELLPIGGNDLYAYGWDALRRNLDVLAQLLDSSGMPYEYLTLSAFVANDVA